MDEDCLQQEGSRPGFLDSDYDKPPLSFGDVMPKLRRDPPPDDQGEEPLLTPRPGFEPITPPAELDGNDPPPDSPAGPGSTTTNRPGIDISDAKIDPRRAHDDAYQTPPTYKESLQYRRGDINDKLADRDRWLYRVLAAAGQGAVSVYWPHMIERPTAGEAAQLNNISHALAGHNLAQQATANLATERQEIRRIIDRRGMFSGLSTTAAVSGANYLIDQVLFPHDHIKDGTLAGDLTSISVMFAPGRWLYKGLGMVGLHAAGRIYDHFLQGNEATNYTRVM